jgi:hypothetical protein
MLSLLIATGLFFSSYTATPASLPTIQTLDELISHYISLAENLEKDPTSRRKKPSIKSHIDARIIEFLCGLTKPLLGDLNWHIKKTHDDLPRIELRNEMPHCTLAMLHDAFQQLINNLRTGWTEDDPAAYPGIVDSHCANRYRFFYNNTFADEDPINTFELLLNMLFSRFWNQAEHCQLRQQLASNTARKGARKQYPSPDHIPQGKKRVF